MGLKIKRVTPPYIPPTAEPDAMYSTKVRGILKPMHPFLLFEVLKMDLATTVDFRIGFRDLVIEGKNLNDGQQFIMGTWPGFWFDREQSIKQEFQRLELYKLFEQYVFKCLSNFILEIVAQASNERRSRMILFENKINWLQVLDYWGTILKHLPMFRMHGDFSKNTDCILMPVSCYKVDTCAGVKKFIQEPLMWPMNIGGFEKAGLDNAVAKFAQEKGKEFANWKLKQHLNNLLIQSLYYCQWNLTDDQPV